MTVAILLTFVLCILLSKSVLLLGPHVIKPVRDTFHYILCVYADTWPKETKITEESVKGIKGKEGCEDMCQTAGHDKSAR